MSTTSPSLLEDADAIVREYLTWRGFASTLQRFAVDQRDDSLHGLSSKRLVQKLVSDVDELNLESIFSWWDEGVGPLLSRVDDEVAAVGRGLKDATYRWYLVTCSKLHKTDLILTFFKGKSPLKSILDSEALTPNLRPQITGPQEWVARASGTSGRSSGSCCPTHPTLSATDTFQRSSQTSGDRR